MPQGQGHYPHDTLQTPRRLIRMGSNLWIEPQQKHFLCNQNNLKSLVVKVYKRSLSPGKRQEAL